jgi:hypothetical protein
MDVSWQTDLTVKSSVTGVMAPVSHLFPEILREGKLRWPGFGMKLEGTIR